MLIAFSRISGMKLYGTDGFIGTIKDVYIDGDSWQVRYLIIDTGRWLSGRKILIAPAGFGDRDWEAGKGQVQISQQQVEQSPDIDLMKPVSRRMEEEMLQFYDWPVYWGAGVGGGLATVPPATSMPQRTHSDIERETESNLPNFRSASELRGYHIGASDGDIGHVEEFVIDDKVWTVRYVVVDTKNWFPGRKVLIAPDWISSVSWSEMKVNVDLRRGEIKDSPKYDPFQPINRAFEEHLYDYYGRERYWIG